MAKLKTPFAGLIPPLSTEQFEALKSDIKMNGILQEIITDEDGNILDGHHRYKIDSKAPTRTIIGLSESEKVAFVIRNNLARRNMTPDQRKEVQRRARQEAEKMRQSDPKRWTLDAIAAVFGVTKQAVHQWFSNESSSLHNSTLSSAKTSGKTESTKPARTTETEKPDARVKINKAAQKVIAQRAKKGESQEQIAADFGVSQKTVSNVVKRDKEKQQQEKRQKETLQKVEKEVELAEIFHDDWRKVVKTIPDGSVDLIFTDPPYFADCEPHYYELAEEASRILVDGGSLVTYCSHPMLPRLALGMGNHLQFQWIFSIIHSGQLALIPRQGIRVVWKPLIWLTKGNNRFNSENIMLDGVESKQDKGAHDWQQGIEEAKYFIEKLSRPGSLVFEPFCGGATTPAACEATGRKWIACDVDGKSISAAKKRIQLLRENNAVCA